MPTSPVVATVSGASFSVGVTAASLDSVLSIRDFLVLENGTLTLNPNSYTKTTATTLTYGGPSLVSTTLEIRRSTPRSQRTTVLPNTKVRAADWNFEFDRRVRIQEEIDLYGAGGGFTVRLPNDTAYGVSWASDSLFPPTRRVVYNQIETLAPRISPTFTGVPLVPTATLGDNSTQVANTAFVTAANSLLAPIASPLFTGNPTVTTQLISDSSTRIANTAYVKNVLGGSPAITSPSISSATFTGTTTVPSLTLGNITTQAANALQVARSCRPIVIVSRTAAYSTVAAFQDIVYNNTIRDTSTAYNTTTGVFTAPYAGIYAFSTHGQVSGTCSFLLFSVVQTTGTELARICTVSPPAGVNGAISGRVLVFLNAGDTRKINVNCNVVLPMFVEGSTTSMSNMFATIEYLGIDT